MLLPLLYLTLFIILILKWNFFSTSFLSKKQYVLLFSLKLLGGLALYFVYTYHYTYRNTSDAFRYFDDALVVFNDITTNPKTYFKILLGYNANDPDCFIYYNKMSNWTKEFDYGLYNDNRTIIRANMLMLLFSWGNYFVHIIILNFLSFIGLILTCKSFSEQLQIKPFVVSLLVFISPSLLFWGSGVLKEGVLLFGLGLLMRSFQKILENKNSYFAMLACSVLILAYTKFYVLISIAPALVAAYLNIKLDIKNTLTTFISLYLISFIFLVFLAPILIDYNFLNTLSAKQNDFINVAITWDAKSKIEIPRIDNKLINLFIYLPQALFNSLFRPIFFDAKNQMMYINSFENLLYLALLLVSIIFCNRKKANNLIYIAIFFCLTLGALIGWVTPILGAIVRYKIPLLPFFIIIPVYYLDFEKLPDYISKPITLIYNTIEKWTQ